MEFTEEGLLHLQDEKCNCIRGTSQCFIAKRRENIELGREEGSNQMASLIRYFFLKTVLTKLNRALEEPDSGTGFLRNTDIL